MGFKAIISKLRDRFKSSAVQGDGGKMKAQLYFTPTSCGAASYIAATKAGLIGTKVDANLADIMTKKIKSGAKKGGDFKEVNPKGNVPALVLPDGTLLNENAAVLQWIADQNPDAGLSPASGNARYLLQAKISYIASEVHANAGPLFGQLEPGAKEAFVAALKKRLDYLSNNDLAGGKKYLVGDTFTIADSYLYICLSWLGYLGLNLGDWPVLKAYSDGIAELDFVKAAHEAMSKLDAANK